MNITVVGVGWTRGQLTLDAIEAIRDSGVVVLHTARCGCADWLRENGLCFESLDALYDSCDDFDAHARAAADAVVEAAERGSVAYVVSDVRDRSVAELIERAGGGLRILPGPPSEGALLALARGETRLVEASAWEDFHPSARENCLVREIDTRELAAEVKLRLMEAYPDDCEIWLLRAEAEPVAIRLYSLDRGEDYDHRTCALVPAQTSITELERYDFGHLLEIIERLCAPDGCPWDRVQTYESLRSSLLEETYEVIGAVEEGDADHLYDELGDLMMLVAMYAEIGRRHGEFDMTDVTSAICEKLISRHTHIFGDDDARDAEQVLHLWNKNKMIERNQSTRTQTLRSVARSLPATLRAVKVLRRSADAGMEDDGVEDVLRRCEALLKKPWPAGDCELQLGELLFEISGLARLVKVDPEIALNGAVDRFIDRFEAMEREIAQKGEHIEDLAKETLRNYWNSVKL